MFSRLSAGLNRGAEIGCLLLLVAMIGVTFAQVFFRFVIVHSLPWSEEFSRYAFVWASFLGASIAVKRGLHIGVEALVARLSRERRQWLSLATLAITFLFLSVVIVKGFQLASFNMRQVSPAMRIPMGLPYLAIPVGSLLMAIHLFDAFLSKWHDRRKPISAEKTEAEKRVAAGF